MSLLTAVVFLNEHKSYCLLHIWVLMFPTKVPLRLSFAFWGKLFRPTSELASKHNAAFACITPQTSELNQRRSLVISATHVKFQQLLKTSTSNENALSLYMLQAKRGMAKSKDRKKEKKSDKPKVILDDDDMEKVLAYEDFKLEINSIIEELKTDLKLNYNVRLNPRQIET